MVTQLLFLFLFKKSFFFKNTLKSRTYVYKESNYTDCTCVTLVFSDVVLINHSLSFKKFRVLLTSASGHVLNILK